MYIVDLLPTVKTRGEEDETSPVGKEKALHFIHFLHR